MSHDSVRAFTFVIWYCLLLVVAQLVLGAYHGHLWVMTKLGFIGLFYMLIGWAMGLDRDETPRVTPEDVGRSLRALILGVR